jgi:hypothetical protein
MKRFIFFFLLPFFLATACHHGGESPLMSGLWKIRKVEVLKNNTLQKVIDTGCQYWSFAHRCNLRIFDTHRLQNNLHICFKKNTFQSFDSTTGELKDIFQIQELAAGNLALSSHKKMMEDDYHIIYYLDKVADTLEGSIQNAY